MSRPSERPSPLLLVARASLLNFATVLLLSSGSDVDAQPLTITHLAGSDGGFGWFDGTGSAARFHGPAGVAADRTGHFYVADTLNHTIRKISLATGEVTTMAGLAEDSGSADGAGSSARFYHPAGTAVDGTGNVYVADADNSVIRRISPSGIVSTLAGLAGSSGGADGIGTDSRFDFPLGVAVDDSGYLYVADTRNHTIRKISLATGEVTTLAGLAGNSGSADGSGSAARFNGPSGVVVDGSGSLYVADQGNNTVRKITPSGVVSTIAGLAETYGSTDGTGSDARFHSPWGVAVDGSGNVYVSDFNNSTLRKIAPSGYVSTLAGLEHSFGSADGAGSAARFRLPAGVAVDGAGNVYMADYGNGTIRKVTAGGIVSTVAGLLGPSESADGIGSNARFGSPRGVAVDTSGNVYVADSLNHTIRLVTAAGAVSTLAGLAGTSGSSDDTGIAALFSSPRGVAADSSGNSYVADYGNDTIRKISPTGVVSTLAGLAGSSGSEDGAGPAARFAGPYGVAVDGSGKVYVADEDNNTIRRITPIGVVSTVAGLAASRGSTDGTGPEARFNSPRGVAVDGSGNVYVADTYNHTIRKVSAAGAVSTLAGLAGTSGSSDGTGSAARFYWPEGVAVDGSGNVYVADTYNDTVRKVTPAGVVTTVAGAPVSPGGADGTGPAARFFLPTGVAVDDSGIVFVADAGNSCIRKGTAAVLADTATIDLSTGSTGQDRQLDTSPQSATRWLWQEVRRPSGSAATLSSMTIRNPTFIPDVPDLYVFRLTASDDSGLQSSTMVSLTATEPPVSVSANFTWTENPVAGQPIQFTDASTGSPTSWSWNFGDGYSSTAQSPIHSFATAGSFAVTLTASNGGGSNSATKTVTVASAGASSCVEDAVTMCIAGGRYRVRSHWRNQYAGSTVSTLSKAKLTDLTGAFWLTNADTYEYLIRITTATDNGRAWIAIATFTDVEFWIDVTDAVSGQSKEYHSAPGSRALIYDPYFFVYP